MIYFPLKYGDICVYSYFIKKIEIKYYSKIFHNGLSPIEDGDVSDFVLVYNKDKKKEVRTYLVAHFDYVNKLYFVPAYFHKIIKASAVCFKQEIEETVYSSIREKGIFAYTHQFKFRKDPVPYIWRGNKNLSRGGSSKKGLVFSSYKKSFDEQCFDYDFSKYYTDEVFGDYMLWDDYNEEEYINYNYDSDAEILNYSCPTLKYHSNKIKKVYNESDMDYWNSKTRQKPKRSWKHTKKQKQWM